MKRILICVLAAMAMQMSYGQVSENDAPPDDFQPEIGMNSEQYDREEKRGQEYVIHGSASGLFRQKA